ncbi:Isochorismatase hydrolase, partial [Marasmius fiardii PR-910]
MAKVFGLPVVMTTSGQSGPNGPLPKEILDMHKDQPLIKRQGELNAWDNEEFRAAVKVTGKRQVILAAITTDVCATFLALSLIEEGYEVYHNSDASGAASVRTAKDANDRMRAAGVQVMGQYALACELMRDWRDKPGALEMFPLTSKYVS